MKKNINLIIIILLVTFLNGQDKLVTLSGKEYSGKYVDQTNDKIEFIQTGHTNSVLVPKESVQVIILENGDTIDFNLVENSTPTHGTTAFGEGVSAQDDTDSESDVMAIGSGYNPCEDERYLQIKEKSLDDMSDREYNYFLSADKECRDYKEKIPQTTEAVKIKKMSAGTINQNLQDNSYKQSQQSVNVTNLATYEVIKKSPAMAGLLSFFIPTTGHAYVGNWERGVLFLLGKIIAYVIMAEGIEEKTETIEVWGPDITNTYYEYTQQYTIGALGLVALGIAEIVDAVDLTNKHNAKLAKIITQ